MATQSKHHFLGCPCCCRTGLILMVVCLLAYAALRWLPTALAAPGVALQACGRTTCAAASKELQRTLGTTGYIIVQPSIVVAVAAIPECSKCAQIVTTTKQSFLVLGTVHDISCQLFGGDKCVAGK